MANGWRQGYYTPKHPEKYKGNVENIVYRSSWELSFCQFLDNNPNIIAWNSEEIAIPYIKPTDGRPHKYYPDFYIKYKNKHGEIKEELIEIKPENQTKPPKPGKGKRKKYQLQESLTYAINIAKWESATLFCNKYGIKFRVLTEKQLFKG